MGSTARSSVGSESLGGAVRRIQRAERNFVVLSRLLGSLNGPNAPALKTGSALFGGRMCALAALLARRSRILRPLHALLYARHRVPQRTDAEGLQGNLPPYTFWWLYEFPVVATDRLFAVQLLQDLLPRLLHVAYCSRPCVRTSLPAGLPGADRPSGVQPSHQLRRDSGSRRSGKRAEDREAGPGTKAKKYLAHVPPSPGLSPVGAVFPPCPHGLHQPHLTHKK